MATHPKQKRNPYVPTAIAIFALVCVTLTVWIALSPSLDRGRMQERQAELLDRIENGDGVIVLDEAFAAMEVDFYSDGGDAKEPDFTPAVVVVETQTSVSSTTVEPAVPVDTTVTGIGVLTIERIGAKLPVTEGVSTAQLKVAVGHVPATPEIGATGNAVIAGHRSYTYGQFFNRLGELEAGDIIRYQPKGGEVKEFIVFEILEILPQDPTTLEQPDDRSIITLLTCTPIRTATHRLLIRAELIINE